MTDRPSDSGDDTTRSTDPSDEVIEQSKRETKTYAGQAGYGVEFEEGRFVGENMQNPPTEGRSGSYETNNQGGYGTGQPDADGETHSDERGANNENA